MERVRSSDVDACTSTEVLQEILYRYAALRRLDLAREVYDLFAQLCPFVFPVTLADTDRAKVMLGTVRSVGVRDAIHASVMLNNDVTEIATFDAGFDRIPGVARIKLG
jgi:predicted nucleic acid-binding protein